MLSRVATLLALLATPYCAGCQSPYHADQGALFGGLTGAGLGALAGNAMGNTAAGAVIGAGVGAVSGAAVGGALDDIEARNRAQIEAQIGQRLPAGGVSINDVLALHQSGVDPQLIVNHVRANGMARPLQAGDLIMLQQQGLHRDVIAAMQTSSVPINAPPPQAGPVIVEQHHYGYPYPHYGYYHYHRRPGPRVGWGVSFGRGCY